MKSSPKADRRTVLKTIGISVVGGEVLTGSTSAAPGGGRDGGRGPKNVVEIVGTHDEEADEHRFDFSDEEIPSGWTTFTFDNQTTQTHFVYMTRIPNADEKLGGFDGETLREKYLNAISLPFQEAWDPYWAGEIGVGGFFEKLGEALPPWFFAPGGVVPSGGVGLTAGEKTARTTLNLTEGTYIAECYVLGEEGVFHSTTGMVESFEVTGETSKMATPEPSLDASVSADGLTFDEDDVSPGRHTIGITFEDNIGYNHGLGHDVHLIRLDEGTTIDEVNIWMDYLDFGAGGMYADRGALTSTHDTPGPQTFLGGVQDIFASTYPVTAYSHVALKPGEYALVAEVPDPADKGLLQEFTVTPPGHRP